MRIHKLIATGLGTGYSPLAPGTAGSILGTIMLFAINSSLVHYGVGNLSILALNLVLIVATTLLGVYSIRKVHQIWEHDSGKIVIDEVVGVWVATLFVPLQWEYYLLALILFRLFDIIKPFFIRRLDHQKTNWSVMLDDLLAGVYANIILQVVIYLSLF